MDVPLLERLVSLMSEHGLTSMELQDGEQKISLSRGGPVATAHVPVAPPAPPMPSTPATPQTPTTPTAPADTSGLVEIKSPMVGTFYAAANPDAKSFVSVGSKVGPDTDVCVIEAMKVFNTIQAETSGTIEKILVENGQPVEFGQALFLVKPA